MSQHTVIPGSAGRVDYVRVPSSQAAGQEFEAKQFAAYDAANIGQVKKAAADETGELAGISTKDEVDGEVELYIGPVLKVKKTTGATITLLEEVYVNVTGTAPSEVAEVHGPTDASGNATGLGYALRETANWVLVRTVWLVDRAPAASPS